MTLTGGRHVHAEAVQIVAVFGHQTVGRQRILIVRPNVGRIRLRKVVFVPLQQQTVLDCLLIVLAIRAQTTMSPRLPDCVRVWYVPS